ncbi:MucR family transcriptional regulator [Methylobacterium sp. J-090]|uniref:MucR family transcriptional regulator n=1 Tax=Methylobacterium sp. J-090 TaxID=2836666 RepID=UPI001FBB4569|nr:MucR family transcriptional regulator [Methylobacterium sp. J-090]MCJ2080698.1 MucR family transcriptional regulator [Methylobacterium sp. J-090]
MNTDGEMMPDYIGLAADIVSAFVSNNSVPPVELPALIASVHATLERLTAPVTEEKSEPLQPAVSIKRSITPDYLVCLEDGKKFKSLKRHLRTRYDMTPDQYRAKWNLASDYPMVAPNYAAARSELAKNMGLGQQRRKQVAAVVEPKAPAPRGRRPRATEV